LGSTVIQPETEEKDLGLIVHQSLSSLLVTVSLPQVGQHNIRYDLLIISNVMLANFVALWVIHMPGLSWTTRSSAIAESPRVASCCCWVFWL